MQLEGKQIKENSIDWNRLKLGSGVKLDLNGSTFTNSGSPVSPKDLVNKEYVDALNGASTCCIAVDLVVSTKISDVKVQPNGTRALCLNSSTPGIYEVVASKWRVASDWAYVTANTPSTVIIPDSSSCSIYIANATSASAATFNKVPQNVANYVFSTGLTTTKNGDKTIVKVDTDTIASKDDVRTLQSDINKKQDKLSSNNAGDAISISGGKISLDIKTPAEGGSGVLQVSEDGLDLQYADEYHDGIITSYDFLRIAQKLEAGQADWNENNPNATTYVQGRTHYIGDIDIITEVSPVALPQAKVTEVPGVYGPLEVGESYVLSTADDLNRVTAICEETEDGPIVIWNSQIVLTQEEIAEGSYTYKIENNTSKDTIVTALFLPNKGEVKTLDPMFLPDITIEELGESAEAINEYRLTINGEQYGANIVIPKDKLITDVKVGTVTDEDVAEGGKFGPDTEYYGQFTVGDRYLDFTVNVSEGSPVVEKHLYVNITDFVDLYKEGDGISIEPSTEKRTSIVSIKLAEDPKGLVSDTDGLRYDDTAIKEYIDAADETLQGNIDAEAERATAAEEKLTEDLASEVERATGAESKLAEDLNTETERATTAEEKLTGDLASEVERATGAEEKLTTDLASEVERATGAEDKLSEDLASEVERATNAEDKLTEDLGAEVERATVTEEKLTTDLASEVERATGAESKLTDDLASEVERATAAEEKLASDLAAEIKRSSDAEEVISNNLSAEVERAKGAETVLQNNLKTEGDNRRAEDENLQEQIDALVGQGHFRFKGVVSDFSALESITDAETGEVYVVTNEATKKHEQEIDKTFSENVWYIPSSTMITDMLNDTDVRRGMATVNGVEGIILLPHNFEMPTGFTFNDLSSTAYQYTSNSIDSQTWEKLDLNGAVFLPVAKRREGTSYINAYQDTTNNVNYMSFYRLGDKYNYNYRTSAIGGQTLTATKGYGLGFGLPSSANASANAIKLIDQTDASATFRAGSNNVSTNRHYGNAIRPVKNIVVENPGSDTYFKSGSTYFTFAKGNLQYNVSSNEYRFAENQYDVISTWSTTGWIDSFGYGCGGDNFAANLTSTNEDDTTYPIVDITKTADDAAWVNKIKGKESVVTEMTVAPGSMYVWIEEENDWLPFPGYTNFATDEDIESLFE